MIRINLLPAPEAKQRKSVGEFFLGSLAIFAVLAVILVVHYNQAGKIKKTNNEIKIVNNQIKKLQEIEKQVKEFKKKNREARKKMETIAILKKQKTGPLYVMDSLSTAIPEKLWLNEFKYKKNKATLVGVAWNEFTVADFMEKLQKSNYFKGVKIKMIEKRKIKNLPLRRFAITSSLDLSGKKVEPDSFKKDVKKTQIQK